MSAVLAFGLMSVAPLAFAEEESDPFGMEPDAVDEEGVRDEEDAPEQDDDEFLGSAFRLGDVTIACTSQDGAEGAPTLAVGVPVERTYVITNEGERAHVRLASSLMFDHLAQPSELGVSEAPLVASDAEGAESDDTSGEDGGGAELSQWRLADDGWWYRSEPLEAGERIEVHVMVEVPYETEWMEAFSTGAPSNITEALSVEAVQARNTSIDLDAERPWGGLMVGSSQEGSSDGEASDSECPSDTEDPSEEESEA